MTLVVLSSAYIDNELRSEYGALPHTFLPIGNMRLFELILPQEQYEDAIITLPRGFEIPSYEQHSLDEKNIKIVPLDEHLSVTQAIQASLEFVSDTAPLRIIFGDTYVELDDTYSVKRDFVVVDKIGTSHRWTQLDTHNAFSESENMNYAPDSLVVCGAFGFSCPKTLASCFRPDITLANLLNTYDAKKELARIRPRKWLDFGHITNLYHARKDVMISRSFNTLKTKGDVCTKSSLDKLKMTSEVNWYETIPPAIKLHTPRFMGVLEKDHSKTYDLEYLYLPTLADLYVFGRVSQLSWTYIFRSILDILKKMQATPVLVSKSGHRHLDANAFFQHMIIEKTHNRIVAFLNERNIDEKTHFYVNGTKTPSLVEISHCATKELEPLKASAISLWHGDLFFGNMFWDSRATRAYIIDPRGIVQEAPSVFGGLFYDIGKLAHSIFGKYDVIVAGYYKIVQEAPHKFTLDSAPVFNDESIKSIFEDYILKELNVTRKQALLLASLLFLSAPPLHKECHSRQNALLATGLLLYLEAEKQ